MKTSKITPSFHKAALAIDNYPLSIVNYQLKMACLVITHLFIIFCLLSCANRNDKNREKVPTPEFSPRGGTTFTTSLIIRISCDLDRVRIMFTTDDTEPDEHSKLYVEPITITETTIFRAKAYRKGYNTSNEVNATFTLNKVAAPIFSLESGIYYEPQEISLRTTTSQAEIYFTINGQIPILHPDFLYEEPFTLPQNESSSYQVQAKAFRENWADSELVIKNYEFRMSRMLPVSGGIFSPYEDYNVSITDFYISNYPVTQIEWQEIMEGNNNNISPNPSLSIENENNPVEQISWYDALVYCNRRSISEGLEPVYARAGNTNPNTWGFVPANGDEVWDTITQDLSKNGYRLPTEMEWVFAARGGNFSNRFIYSGSNYINEVAWYINNSEGTTQLVGDKNPNELQIYDMSGNVWEWCWDWFSVSLSSGFAIDPTGAETGEFRVLRGGSYLHDATRAEIAFRDGRGNAWYRDRDRGFRVVRRM